MRVLFLQALNKQVSLSCETSSFSNALVLPEVMECCKVARTSDGVGDNDGVDVTGVELALTDKLDE